MKKMTFALACASTLALFATDFSVATFEGYTSGTPEGGIGGKGDDGAGNTNVYWQYKDASGSTDGSAVKNYVAEGKDKPAAAPKGSGAVGDNYLDLSTEGGTLWRSFNAKADDLGEAQAVPADTGKGEGLFIDTMVQFTATEDGQAPETAEDDKLAIWLAKDGETAKLMVKGSKLDANLDTEETSSEVVSYELSNSKVTITDGAWYRLTVKAVKNVLNANAPNEYVPAFQIYIDGELMAVTGASVATADFLTFYSEDQAASLPDCLGANKALLVAGTLIPSMAGYSGVDNSALQAVGFKGSGAIDDLKLTDEDPLPKAAPEETFSITTETGVTAAWSTTADGEFTPYAEGQKAPAGKIYVKLTTADGGVKIVEKTIAAGETNALDLTAETFGWAEYLGEAVDGAYVIDDQAEFGKFVAKVATLGSATAEGDPITFKLAADVTFAGVIGAAGNKDNLGTAATFAAGAFKGTFDGGDHTISDVVLPRADYTGLFGSLYGATVKNLTVAVKEGTTGFEAEGGTAEFCGGLVAGVSVKSTIENVTTAAGTFKAQKAAAGIVGYAAGGTVLKNCVNNLNVISIGNEKVAGLVGCAQNTGTYEPAYVTIDGCTNNGNVECQASGKSRAALLVSYSDCEVKFQGTITARGTVTQAGSTANIQSIININSGKATVVDGAVITAPATMKSTIHNGKAHAGLNYATVADGVATFVADSAAVNGANLKVMTTGNTITLANVGDTITLDTTLATATVTTTDTEANEVKQEGNVYTVVAKVIEVTPEITLSATTAEFSDTLALPTVTVAGDYVENTDYTVAWDKTLPTENPAEDVVLTATVTMTGKYTGSATATFTVTPKSAPVVEYPDYIKDDEAKKKFDAWADTNKVADRKGASEKAYLLNVAPDAADAAEAAFKIKSITVDATGKVTVEGPEGEFNGTVEIKGCATLDGEYTLPVTDSAARFFKAFLK